VASKNESNKKGTFMQPIFAERSLPRDGDSAANRRVRSVTVNLAESPLGWLKARGLVSDRQFVAGELLRRDYERACLGPRVTMSWDAAPIGGKRAAATSAGASTHAQISAKQRFDGAIALAGPGLSDILWRVICACEAMPSAEKALGWPARAGRLVLTLALDRVGDFYHISDQAKTPSPNPISKVT
jgi:Domain of unknown function (DUF6456)